MEEKYESIIDRVKREMNEDSGIDEKYSNFLFAYLNQTNKKKVKITNLTLFLNKLPPNIEHFIEHLWVSSVDFIEIKKQKKNYAVFQITEQGELVRNTFEYDERVVRRNYLIRIIYNIYYFIKFCKKTIYETIPNFLNRVFSIKSGKLIMKIITGLGTIIALILGCIELYEWLTERGVV